MKWPNDPENRPVIRQINWLFHCATIWDIDLSQWRECISLILSCGEYIGDDFHQDGGWFQLKFFKVHRFCLTQSDKNDPGQEYFRNALSLHITKFSKELDRETGKRYYCLVLKNYYLLEDYQQLELHFDDAEVGFLTPHYEMKCGCFSSKDRERILKNNSR